MDSKKIASKVLDRLNLRTSADKEFVTKNVEFEYIQELLEERLESELKKEWNIDNIDKQDLDWTWKNGSVKWSALFYGSSGVLNISLNVPDQKIVVTGSVTYTDDKNKDHKHLFNETFEIKKVESVYDDIKIKHDISPEKLSYDKGKWELYFAE